MFTLIHKRPFSVLVIVCSVLVTPAAIPADEYDNVTQLDELFWERYEASQYPEAEKIARRMIEIGRQHWKDDRTLITYGLSCLGYIHCAQGHLAAAEKVAKQVVDIRKAALGEDDGMYGFALSGLADVYFNQGRYREAQRLYRQALQIARAEWGEEDEDVVSLGTDLADVQVAQGRYEQAENLYLKAIKVHEDLYGRKALDLAPFLLGLADIYRDQDRYKEAEQLCRRALGIVEKKLGQNHVETARALVALAQTQYDLEQYTEGTGTCERALRIMEQAVGTDHLELSECLDILAYLYYDMGRSAEAEQAAQRALAILEKTLGPAHLDVAESLVTLGTLYLWQTRYLEAETILTRALSIQEKTLDSESYGLTTTWIPLGTVYAYQGRYAEADELLKRAQTTCEKVLGPENYSLAEAIFARGELHASQGRYDEAETFFLQAQAIFRRIVGQDYSSNGEVAAQLANIYHWQDRNEEAEKQALTAVRIIEKTLGADNLAMSDVLVTLASIYVALDRYDEAKPVFDRASELIEEKLGADNTSVGWVLFAQAEALYSLGRGPEAEPLLDRAIALYERGGVSPIDRTEAYYLRAQVAWDDDRRSEALADLRRAIDLAEEMRRHLSGAEHERAAVWAEYQIGFEKMVEWQTELGDVSEALSAIERSKARSLLDELTRPGVDLQLGRSSLQREQLRQREDGIHARIAGLEKQLEVLLSGPQSSTTGAEQQRQELQNKLAVAREELYQHYRDSRSSSPIYRDLLTVGAGPPRLSQIQSRLVGDNGLMLVYLLGSEAGYLVALGPNSAELAKLIVDEEAARVLQVEAGPLTVERLQAVLMNDQRTGVLQQMSSLSATDKTTERLAALWKTLVPESWRNELTGGKVGRLIVVPDGPLSLLPFETLVVSPGGRAEYLLDVGPPIIYGPSASVLFNLKSRVPEEPPTGLERVLTVGDPDYPAPGALQLAQNVTEQLRPRTRYSNVGGQLARLPNSGTESRWVSQVFQKQDVTVAGLLGPNATESNVRGQASGRQWLHLACHGLVDQAHGNFFGALALTPGPEDSNDPSDDGFLTLAEIYEMDLNSCELAILSACRTNYGPEQRGEGVWGISRGFLVAGARRVVASNWLVDDQAAASLISYFCSGVANGQKQGQIDYAQALQNAKRWVRQQDKWQSPFYWATFVLVGPN